MPILAQPGIELAPPLTAVAPPPVTIETLASDLHHPWAVAFLPEGGYLVTERRGQLLRIDADGKRRQVINGVPPVHARGQGGLLDLVLAPDFARSRTLYFCYAEPSKAGARTTVAQARLEKDSAQLEDVQVLFRQSPALPGDLHFGCRLVVEPDGAALVVTLGDRFTARDAAQRLDNHLGKTVRLAARSGEALMRASWQQRCQRGERAACAALPEIYTWGHRNSQGAVWHGSGSVWMIEHGPQGGDELNRLEAGGNYGWPLYTFGEEYGGGKIGRGSRHPAPFVAPLVHWTPSIAPSGMAVLMSDRYGLEWQGSVLVGSLKFGEVRWLQTVCDRVLHEAVTPIGARVRDVRVGPDGLVYVLTDAPDGQLLRLKPQRPAEGQ